MEQEITLKSGKKAILVERLGDDEVLVELMNGVRRPVHLKDVKEDIKSLSNSATTTYQKKNKRTSKTKAKKGTAKAKKKPKCGFVGREPDDQYFAQNADKLKIGSTMLKEFVVNRKLFYKRYVEKSIPSKEVKACYTIGHVVEEALLFGKLDMDRVVRVDCSSEKTKKFQDAVKANPDNAFVLTESDWNLCEQIIENAKNHPVIKSLVSNGQPQQVFRIETPHCYLQCKVDWWQTGLAFDMKSTACIHGAGNNSFDRQIWSLGYDVQSAFYRMIIQSCTGSKPDWQWVAVEKQEPFDVELVDIQAQAMDSVERAVTLQVADLLKCFETGNWENADGVRTVEMPAWRLYELGTFD